MKKICPGCSEERDAESDFSWKNMAKGTRQRWCKSCQAVAMKKHYQDNKQPYLDRTRERSVRMGEENPRKLYEYLLSHPCVDCGYSDIRALEFDHVRGNKKRSISRMLSKDCSWHIIAAEIEKCEVRCANCHRVKTNDERSSWRSLFSR